MGQLDDLDAMLASGKLEALIQLPYTIKTDLQRAQAEERIKGIESAMAKNKHGISYVDGSEKVIQLNRQLNSQLVDDINNLNKAILQPAWPDRERIQRYKWGVGDANLLHSNHRPDHVKHLS